MRFVVTILLLIVAATTVMPTWAADKPNLLIVGEDVGSETIPRNSRVFRSVVDALTTQMGRQGFEVYDQSALSLGKFDLEREQMSDGDIIELARAMERPPIDVVVMFAIYADVDSQGYTTKLNANISGRMLNVHSNKRLGNFAVKSPKPWNVNSRCNRDCIIKSVGSHAKTLANDLGHALALKLDASHGDDSSSQAVSAYTLIFDNFTASDLLDIEEYLVIFSGYKSHRPTVSSATRTELWYQSSIGSAKLNRNLKKMLNHLELKGAVQFSGNTFTVEQIVLLDKKRQPKADDWD
jgi:hypothetical protein